ncbi:glutamate racemase [Sharpea azabuensis]|uniref:glutamate racemase n=1 Tax=Sharpea azabuensis TaxID=322505 RepID=UPI0013DC0D81|nr:glutamate racemase [Sharpea azabuensis]
MKKDLNGYIGVFDSGLGGISVLKEMVKLLPHEKFYFYGDSARAPYGERTLKEVQDYTMETMNNMVNHGVKAVVVACNTATSAAIEMVRNVFTDIIVIGVEPALKPAAEAHDGEILVMATENTLRLDKYHELAKTYGNHVNVKEVACNGLAQAIETGDVDGEEVRVVLHKLLAPYKGEVKSVVLGCTHYPFVKKAIREVLGEEIKFYDGAAGTARQLANKLEEAGKLNTEGEGEVVFESSKNDPEEIALYKSFLNKTTD